MTFEQLVDSLTLETPVTESFEDIVQNLTLDPNLHSDLDLLDKLERELS